MIPLFFSRESDSTIANVRPSVCLSVCLSVINQNPQQLKIFILHSSSFILHPSSFIINHSSFIFHHLSFISRLLSFSACFEVQQFPYLEFRTNTFWFMRLNSDWFMLVQLYSYKEVSEQITGKHVLLPAPGGKLI